MSDHKEEKPEAAKPNAAGAKKAGPPLPSTIVPPRMTRSGFIAAPPGPAGGSRAGPSRAS